MFFETDKGALFKYVDQILPIIDPLPIIINPVWFNCEYSTFVCIKLF